VADLSRCPRCGSALLQPLRSRPVPDVGMLVDLRCPECFAWMQETCSRAELAALDRSQAASREALVGAYEQSIAESMALLADCLAAALALDLVDADDFARPQS